MRPAAPMIARCQCEHCARPSIALDRFALAAGTVAFMLVPGRALLHLAGIL